MRDQVFALKNNDLKMLKEKSQERISVNGFNKFSIYIYNSILTNVNLLQKNKKGISQLITTILLILISIFAVIIISSVIIPFVRDSLSGSKECFETFGQLTINTESGYTCYYNITSEKKIVNITVQRGPKETEMVKFKISVSGEGKNNLFEIKEGTVTDVKMLDGSPNIEVPKQGEERTYSLNTSLGEVLYAEVYPILESGKMCEAADKADIEKCS